jgi:hypothetical protein
MRIIVVGIKLDWQVEADQAFRRAGEDPAAHATRRTQRIRLVLFTLGIFIAASVVAGGIWLRLYTVDDQLRRDMIDTVQAEDATLRLGDYTQFIAIQRSADGSWLQQQGERFKRYQDLKSKSDLNLTGKVLDTEIDGSRGRALVEEILDGVEYHTVWFYWRFPDGWRHVPSDYTFWGAQSTLNGKSSSVSYSQVDAGLAQALSTRVDKWWATGCSAIGCGVPPTLQVEIIPYQSDQPKWDPNSPNTLIIASPLAQGDRTIADPVISTTLEDAVAQALADHLLSIATNNLKPVQTADAAWLRASAVSWLAATFTGRGNPTPANFIQSVNEHYGAAGVSAVLHALTQSSDISIVGIALKQPIESLALDWRTFFQWRLDVEKTLLSRNDIADFQALWDSANPAALNQMRQRMARPTQATPQVQTVAISPGADGIPRAAVQVTADGQPATIIFRLDNGGWKRSA